MSDHIQPNSQKETVGHALSARSECSHTPGPWKVEINEKSARAFVYGRLRDQSRIRQSDGYGVVALVDCAEDPDAAMYSPMFVDRLADARLIAAAPDLFKQLSLVRTMLANSAAYDEVQGHTEDASYTRKVIADIDAVLSAAKGGA